jgi:hypothetical protein
MAVQERRVYKTETWVIDQQKERCGDKSDREWWKKPTTANTLKHETKKRM